MILIILCEASKLIQRFALRRNLDMESKACAFIDDYPVHGYSLFYDWLNGRSLYSGVGVVGDISCKKDSKALCVSNSLPTISVCFGLAGNFSISIIASLTASCDLCIFSISH
jgi:hypothetical protein